MHWPSLGIALSVPFGGDNQGSTDMSRQDIHGLLRGDAVNLRSKPSSRTDLTGEQPDPWHLLQPQDATSRHRGAKPLRRYGLLGAISLLSPEYLLAVERRPYHEEPSDH